MTYTSHWQYIKIPEHLPTKSVLLYITDNSHKPLLWFKYAVAYIYPPTPKN